MISTVDIFPNFCYCYCSPEKHISHYSASFLSQGEAKAKQPVLLPPSALMQSSISRYSALRLCQMAKIFS